MLAYLYIGNTHSVKLTGLHDPNVSPIVYLNATATITATIYDTAGTAVTDGTCTLNYVEDSDGNFLGHLSYAADVSINKSYKIRISVNDGAGKRARWDVRANTIYRDGD